MLTPVTQPETFFDEATCRRWLVDQIHPAGPRCPDCGLQLSAREAESFYADRRVVCKQCGRWFTARTGTILEGARISWRQAVLLAMLLELGIERDRIATIVGLHPETVRAWHKRMQEALV